MVQEYVDAQTELFDSTKALFCDQAARHGDEVAGLPTKEGIHRLR